MALSDRQILQIACRQQGFSVSWRIRDDVLRRRCEKLRRTGLIKLIYSRGQNDYVITPKGKELLAEKLVEEALSMTDTVNKQALDIIASRERQQREYGNPVNLEIARELRAIIQDIKELPPTPSTPVQGCREALDIELALLQMWERNDIQEIFKYKRRIHYFRERLSNIELFYDLSFVLFADVDDIASKDITPEEGKVSVAELIRKRQALSQTDIQLISAEQELDIVRSAKDSLMRYTQKCRTERDYWQTRAIDAEQELSNLKNGPGINSTEDDQPGPSVDIISSVDFSPVPPEKQAIIEKAFDAAFSSTEEEETDV